MPERAGQRHHRGNPRNPGEHTAGAIIRHHGPRDGPLRWRGSPAGLDRRIAQEVGDAVIVADDPLTCVARGTGILLDTPEGLPRSLENPSTIPIAEGSVNLVIRGLRSMWLADSPAGSLDRVDHAASARAG